MRIILESHHEADVVDRPRPLGQLGLLQLPEHAPLDGVLELLVELLQTVCLLQLHLQSFHAGHSLKLVIFQNGRIGVEWIAGHPLFPLLVELEAVLDDLQLFALLPAQGLSTESTLFAALACRTFSWCLRAQRFSSQKIHRLQK